MKYTKDEFLKILHPQNMCIINSFECSRNGNMDSCKYLTAWNDLMEYINNLEKALDKACYELGALGNNLLGMDQWKDWCFDE